MENTTDSSVPSAVPASLPASPAIRPGRSASRFLFESLLIVISVVLGFAVTQWRESVVERRLAARVVSDVVVEVQANLAQVQEQFARHERLVQQLELALAEVDAADPALSGLDFVFSRIGPDFAGRPLRSAAWEAAISSGSLRLVDYEIAAALSEIYVGQEEMYDALTYQTASAIFAPDTFDPARRGPVARMLQGLMIEVSGRERFLLDIYERHLPLLREAAARAE